MNFYTVVLRKSKNDWVTMCLENGTVGQGTTKDDSIRNLKDAIDSFEEVRAGEEDIHCSPISIDELNEFLAIENCA